MAGAFRRSKLAAMTSDRVRKDSPGHSLRAGFLIQAGWQNANLFEMREHSRHASLEKVGECACDHEQFHKYAAKGFL